DLGELDRLADDRLGVAMQHVLQHDRRLVARAARAAAGIATLALLELHFPFSSPVQRTAAVSCATDSRGHAAAMAAAPNAPSKNPARSPARVRPRHTCRVCAFLR